MNFNDLFEVQAELDKRIIDEHNLHGHDLLHKKCVAMICELYEAANEARFFKYWSKDQKPRKKRLKYPTMNEEDKEYYNPLLEEYVDTLHFALSIGNDLGYTHHEYNDPGHLDMNHSLLGLTQLITVLPYANEKNMGLIFDYLINFGYQLGFTEKDVRDAYFEKNKTNHERQENGY